MYKVFEIRKEAYEKCETGIIDDKEYFWISRRDL